MDSVMIINFEKNSSEAYGLHCLLKCSMTFAVAPSLLESIFYVTELFIGTFFVVAILSWGDFEPHLVTQSNIFSNLWIHGEVKLVRQL